MRFQAPFLLVAVLAAAACTPAPAPVAVVPAAVGAPSVGPSVVPSAGTAAPSAAPTAAAALAGVATYFGAPLADAEVFVAPIGQALPAAAAGKTDAQGRFAVGAPAGGLLRVVVRLGEKRAAAIVRVPARALAQVGAELAVDELGAFVYLTFLPRLVAIDGLAAAPPPDPAIAEAALAIFRTATEALRASATVLVPGPYQDASAGLDGALTLPDPTLRERLIAASPTGYLTAMQACGDALNALIRDLVLQRGLPMPLLALLEPIPLTPDGLANAPRVFGDEETDDDEGPGGDDDEGTSASGSVGFEAAPVPFADETAVPEITTAL